MLLISSRSCIQSSFTSVRENVSFHQQSYKMGAKLILCCLAILCVGVAIGLDPNCPLSSSMTSCSPKCKEDSECLGRKCCSNICNTKSCVPANHKDSQNNGYKNQNSKCVRGQVHLVVFVSFLEIRKPFFMDTYLSA